MFRLLKLDTYNWLAGIQSAAPRPWFLGGGNEVSMVDYTMYLSYRRATL
jgi:hypothetical protein